MALAARREEPVRSRHALASTMGVAAVVVGGVALLAGWIPVLAFVAVPVALVGVALAGGGLLVAGRRRFEGIGLPLLGGVLSVAGMGVPILSTATGGEAVPEPPRAVGETESGEGAAARRQEEAIRRARYVAEDVALRGVRAWYAEAQGDGPRVPAVRFEVRNLGAAALERVDVTVYFRDEADATIAQETLRARTVAGGRPLEPGGVWRMDDDAFHVAAPVPGAWVEGRVEARVTGLAFAGEP